MLRPPGLGDLELEIRGFQLFGSHTSLQFSSVFTKGRVARADQMKRCRSAVICDSVCDSWGRSGWPNSDRLDKAELNPGINSWTFAQKGEHI